MIRTVLSIDFDFWAEHDAARLDWGHNEVHLGPVNDLLWQLRAADALNNGGISRTARIPPDECRPSQFLRSLETAGWDVVGARAAIAESHGSITPWLKRTRGPLRVINVDAHADLGYTDEHEPPNCANWLERLIESGRAVEVVHTRLATEVQEEERKRVRMAAAARRRARWAAEFAARQERERNANEAAGLGRKTDAELQAERDAARNAEIAKAKAEAEERARNAASDNAWLIDCLRNLPYSSEFIQAMIDKLSRSALCDLSDRCRQILCDIWSKSHGRRNSKAYNAAEDQFYDRLESAAASPAEVEP
jgi:hypothetical protein